MSVNIAKIENIAKRFTVFLGRTYCLGFLTIFSLNLWTRATSQLICIEIIINKVFNDLKPIVDLPVFLIPVFFPDVFVWNWSNNNNNTNNKNSSNNPSSKLLQPGAHEILPFSPQAPLPQHQLWLQYLSTWQATITGSALCSFRAWRQSRMDRDGYPHRKRCQREKATGTDCCKARQYTKY